MNTPLQDLSNPTKKKWIKFAVENNCKEVKDILDKLSNEDQKVLIDLFETAFSIGYRDGRKDGWNNARSFS